MTTDIKNQTKLGDPWGGHSTIKMSIHAVELAKRGRYTGNGLAKMYQERSPSPPLWDGARSALGHHDDLEASGGFFSPRYSGGMQLSRLTPATMRRCQRGPSPTWDSDGFQSQLQFPEEVRATPLGTPRALTRLPFPEASDRNADITRPCSVPVPRGGMTLEKSISLGLTRGQWSRTQADDAIGQVMATSASPRFAPARYGAAIVRQQRLAGTAHSLRKPFKKREERESPAERPRSVATTTESPPWSARDGEERPRSVAAVRSARCGEERPRSVAAGRFQ